MNKFVMTAITAAALVAGPISASAEAVAVSLSASFVGNLGTVSVADENIIAPTSVAVAGAAGVHAVASSVATGASSGAASGATSVEGAIPFAEVTVDGSNYETNVSFIAPQAVTQDDVDAAAAQAVIDAVAQVCGNGFAVDEDLSASTPINVPFVGTVNVPGTINGTITVNCVNPV